MSRMATPGASWVVMLPLAVRMLTTRPSPALMRTFSGGYSWPEAEFEIGTKSTHAVPKHSSPSFVSDRKEVCSTSVTLLESEDCCFCSTVAG